MTTASQARAREGGPRLDDAFEAELEQMALAVAEPVVEPREPALPRYLKWQARDFLKHRAALLLPLAMLALWIFHYNFADILAERAAQQGAAGLDPGMATRIFESFVRMATVGLGGLGSVFVAAGIVSRDREGGHQRFLFAKPVRIWMYYLQAFVVNGVGLMLTAALVLGITSAAFMRPVPFGELMTAVGITYVAAGGLTLLLSTLVRFEFAAAIMLALLSFPLQQMALSGYWWAIATSWILPPFHLLDAFGPGGHHATPFQAVTSLLGYGAAYIAAAVAVLKRRSIIR